MGSVKKYGWFILPLLCIGLSILYFYYLMPVTAGNMDHALFQRGIGTPLLAWINGYLGSTTSLRLAGNVVWLALPLIVLGAYKWRDLSKVDLGIMLFMIIAMTIIGGAGGFNFRYAFTLVPVLLVFVAIALDKLMRGSGTPIITRNMVFVCLVGVTMINSKMSLGHNKRIAEADAILIKIMPTKESSFADDLGKAPKDLDAWFAQAGIGKDEVVLVNNLPIYFYVTHRPGRYYWCGTDEYYGPSGPEPLFGNRTDQETAAHLINNLGTHYIFSERNLSRYEPRFNTFLEEQCKLIAEDPLGNTIHRVLTKK